MENRFFKAQVMMEGVTRIEGLGCEYAYLIEGTKRALLVDGLVGIGSLKSFVKELTDLPVSVALTHAHIDHNGGAYEYGECYMHPYDIPMLYPQKGQIPGTGLAIHSDRQLKLDYVTKGGFEKLDRSWLSLEDVVQVGPIKTYPLFEGDVFDLGGVQIEVAELPGHTNGTIVFLDRRRRILFSGDACNSYTLLGIPGTTTIEDYKESLERFRAKYGGTFDIMYGGHGTLPPEIISDGIYLCDLILKRKDAQIPTTHRGYPQFLARERETKELCNIVYSGEKLYKKAVPRMIKEAPIIERK